MADAVYEQRVLIFQPNIGNFWSSCKGKTESPNAIK